MTIVLNDPTWGPTISAHRFLSYFTVAALVVMTYDWALTFGQEVELIWRQRWSLMTIMYLGVRYLGIVYVVLSILIFVPKFSLINTKCSIMYVIGTWMHVVILAMLWVIIITRLHAMYQRSRKILIFLIVTFLAVNIFGGVVIMMIAIHTWDKLILSSPYQCWLSHAEDIPLLSFISLILHVVWEVLALCLAVWIAAKHFRELQQHSAGGIIGDYFMVLMKTHMLYSASFVAAILFLFIAYFSQTLARTYFGLAEILMVMRMSVLGLRLVLGIRAYHAKLVADFDAVTAMTSIAFHERTHISTGSGV